jgi:hypothetical protein
LDELQVPYAIGGALALGFWGEPRGTLDVDLTLFVPPERPAGCVELLLELGCELDPPHALESLTEHGFCRVLYLGTRLDVFLPIAPFYEAARKRRREVHLQGQAVRIWDAETLAVFKLMFFRRKDVADVEQILRNQGADLDREWVRSQLALMYGAHDPRLSAWDELTTEQSPKAS